MTILGVWKLLGVAAILSPGMPRLKEWAYAGFFLDLSGAVASRLMSGDSASQAIPPLVVGALAMASWALRPASRKLAGTTTSNEVAIPSRASIPAPA